MTRLGGLEVAEQGRVQAVTHAEKLDGVMRPLRRALLHLHPAGPTLGGTDLDVVVAQPVQ